MRPRFGYLLLLATMLYPSFSWSARDVRIHGGDVHFLGQVVNAACVVSADSQNMTVLMGQVRSAMFHGMGDWSQPVPFQLKLEDCDTAVSHNAGVLFTGVSDGKDPQVFEAGYGASAAQGVGLGIFDGAGNLVIPNTRPPWLAPLQEGETILNYSAKYRATDRQILPGEANAQVWFSVVYQ